MRLFSKKEDEPTAQADARPLILIVEDDEMQALFLQRILEHHDYRVALASNGQEAMQELDRVQPELVISDIVMPEMDGYGLCLAIKEDEALRHLPVVLLTSLTDANDALRGLYCGADGLIAKPYDAGFLLSRVQDILENAPPIGAEAEEATSSTQPAPQGIRVSIGGKKVFVTRERLQTIGLLASSYQLAVQKNHELNEAHKRIRQLETELNAARFTIADLRSKMTE